jgi:polynucleotide 5'-hydroxyl-kinase GRC3/NOL9
MDTLDIQVPQEWHGLAEVLAKEKGIVVLLGATDTGKSTLAKFLITSLALGKIHVALVDADIGQSLLGPPTTIGLVSFESPPNWERLPQPELYFVASTTPEGDLSLHLEGVKRMVNKAVSRRAEVIVVDTTGLVSGEVGKELKQRKIDLLGPHFIVALQISEELEPILEGPQQNPLREIYRLTVSRQVVQRSQEERRAYRRKKFHEYFRDFQTLDLCVDGLPLEGKLVHSNGVSLPLFWALWIKGLLVGLKDAKGDTLALAVIENFEPEGKTLRIVTPLHCPEHVKAIHLSSFRLNPSWEEERI